MLTQLVLATLMVIVTVLVHLTGLAIVLRVLRSHSRTFSMVHVMPFTLLVTAAIGIFTIHTIEIWIYAALYLALGAFKTFEVALYFSTSTYASIGYGDVLLAETWRIFGAIEGATGIIMFGWSTAFLVSLLARLKMLGHDWLRQE
jgi:voltage-gated potassium channel